MLQSVFSMQIHPSFTLCSYYDILNRYHFASLHCFIFNRHKDCICNGGFEGPHCEYKSGTTPTFIANQKSAAFDSPQPLISNTILYSAMAGVCITIGFVMMSFFIRARGRRVKAMKKEMELQRATEELAMVQLDMDDDSTSDHGRPAFI